ncbi:MAG: pca operon transcription factor PcaQ [Aquisalimonadaceae bacterium]
MGTYDRVKQRHLQCFVEIVRRGSLAKAADALAITQSATSKTLSELESVVGERLIERNRRGATLTPAGEIFYRYASASITAVRQGLDLVAHSRRNARRSVLMGALPNVAAELLPRAVAIFKQAHPETPVAVVTGTNRQLLTQLRVAEVDFVVGRLAGPAEMMGLRFEELFYESLALVARPGHPLLAHGALEIEALAGFTILVPLAGTIIRHDCDRFLISHGLTELPDTVETISAEFGRRYTLDSDALWVTPRGMVAADLEQGRLRDLPIDMSPTAAPVGISTRTEAGLTRLSTELIGTVRDVCRDHSRPKKRE